MKKIELVKIGVFVIERLSFNNQVKLCESVLMKQKFNNELLSEIGKIENGIKFIQEYNTQLQLSELIDILNYTDRFTESRIINGLDKINPEFAETIKQNMFVFEDLSLFDKKALRKLMERIDEKLLKIALVSCPMKIRNHILSPLSSEEQKKWMIDINNIDSRNHDINKIQYDIIEEIKTMEKKGIIKIKRLSELENGELFITA